MQIYSVAEVAGLTGKTVQSVRLWCRKNKIERDGRRYLITQDVLSKICSYYHVEPSEYSAFLEDKENEKAQYQATEESISETFSSEVFLLKQMQATIEAKQEQIDFLKEELEKVREDKDREIESLRRTNESALERYDSLQERFATLMNFYMAEKMSNRQLPRAQEEKQDRQEKQGFFARIFNRE